MAGWRWPQCSAGRGKTVQGGNAGKAELEATIIKEDRWVLAIDDIKQAFDNLIIEDVISDHKLYLQDNRLLSLFRVVLQGSGGPRKERGIEQGCPYSPTALNVRLHHAHVLGAE
jgi:hypothetical protein